LSSKTAGIGRINCILPLFHLNKGDWSEDWFAQQRDALVFSFKFYEK